MRRESTAPKLDRRFAEIVREIQACSRIEAEIFEHVGELTSPQASGTRGAVLTHDALR